MLSVASFSLFPWCELQFLLLYEIDPDLRCHEHTCIAIQWQSTSSTCTILGEYIDDPNTSALALTRSFLCCLITILGRENHQNEGWGWSILNNTTTV